MRQWLSVYLKGFFMGAADSVPGVSGGTIALITGIYERLVGAIAAVDREFFAAATRLHTAEGRVAFTDQLRELDLPFLVALGLGIVSALITVTRVMHAALDGYPAPTNAFFFGLIAASAVVLYRHVSLDTPGRIAAAIVGFLLAFLLSGRVVGTSPHTPVVVFLVGTVAVSAMILPGVSGAFLLYLFGQYEFLSGRLETFVDAVLAVPSGGGVASIVDSGTTVVTFVAGAAVGLLTIAHVIEWAFERYHAATLTFLVSLMVGALRLPVELVLAARTDWSPIGVVVVLLAGLVGGAAVLVLDHYTDDLAYGEVEGIGSPAAERAD